ncbi:LexA family protein [Pseudomonas sp. PLMAX]|uniref:LexA family protein n=1 Tax=Pseudomonas sp. PLMAX TaxID=2201998 RepID=UPI0038B965A4
MRKLTPRQEMVYNFLKQFILENGFPPTCKEIATAMEFKSPTGAHDHLARLEKYGFLRIIKGISRGIQIIEDGSPVQPAPVAGDAAPSTSFRSATVTQILDPRNADLRRKILCEKTRFYFEHHEFVENQILAEVTRVDGAHAAVSKTKMYYHSLAESMLTGSPMVFWPQISPATASNAAFDSQADLQEFVDHVRDLFLGKPEGYLKDAQARRLERPGRMAA